MYAYTVLASGGIMHGHAPFQAHNPGERTLDPISILKVTDAKGAVIYDAAKDRKDLRVVGADYAYLITDILKDPNAQCVDFGCGGLNVPGFTVAMKTGASQPFNPNGPDSDKTGETWTFGYTPDVVVGIWAGNSDNAPLVNLLSTTIAFKSVRDTIPLFYGDRKETPFVKPDNVVTGTICTLSGLRASPSCPRTSTDIFIKDQLPSKEDDWWRPINIDTRNGLLAGPNTPPQFIQQQTMLVLPPDILKSDQDKQAALDWAKALGVSLAPTETSNGQPGPGGSPTADLPATIYTPLTGATVNGAVPIQGRAASPAFQAFRVEVGQGANPTVWVPIGQGFAAVQGGTLGIWNTNGLPNGTYTLRLTVLDAQRGPITATQQVNIGPNGAAGTPPTPVPTLPQPPPSAPPAVLPTPNPGSGTNGPTR
jgi:membrane peptidoglycan carboxypeptidase